MRQLARCAADDSCWCGGDSEALACDHINVNPWMCSSPKSLKVAHQPWGDGWKWVASTSLYVDRPQTWMLSQVRLYKFLGPRCLMCSIVSVKLLKCSMFGQPTEQCWWIKPVGEGGKMYALSSYNDYFYLLCFRQKTFFCY